MSPRHTTARDAALRRLSRVNRWMVAGSLALTAVFSEVAASAFPGKTAKANATTTSHGRSGDSQKAPSNGSSSLKPPTQAPQASTTPEVSPSQEPAPSEESAPSQESAPTQESAPSQEAAPSQESAPTQESAPAQEAPVQESSPPVVSGGS